MHGPSARTARPGPKGLCNHTWQLAAMAAAAVAHAHSAALPCTRRPQQQQLLSRHTAGAAPPACIRPCSTGRAPAPAPAQLYLCLLEQRKLWFTPQPGQQAAPAPEVHPPCTARGTPWLPAAERRPGAPPAGTTCPSAALRDNLRHIIAATSAPALCTQRSAQLRCTMRPHAPGPSRC